MKKLMLAFMVVVVLCAVFTVTVEAQGGKEEAPVSGKPDTAVPAKNGGEEKPLKKGPVQNRFQGGDEAPVEPVIEDPPTSEDVQEVSQEVCGYGCDCTVIIKEAIRYVGSLVDYSKELSDVS